jgi:hypothetical protein
LIWTIPSLPQRLNYSWPWLTRLNNIKFKPIPCREVRVRKDFEIENDRHLPPQKDPLGTLQKIGLVERLGQHNVRLRTVAFERAKYERKNRLGKWWFKTIHLLLPD